MTAEKSTIKFLEANFLEPYKPFDFPFILLDKRPFYTVDRRCAAAASPRLRFPAGASRASLPSIEIGPPPLFHSLRHGKKREEEDEERESGMTTNYDTCLPQLKDRPSQKLERE